MILLVTCICSTVVLNDDDQWSRPAKADPPCKKMYYSYSIGYSVTAVERGYDLLHSCGKNFSLVMILWG